MGKGPDVLLITIHNNVLIDCACIFENIYVKLPAYIYTSIHLSLYIYAISIVHKAPSSLKQRQNVF